MIRHPLVPAGYLTVPEALGIVEARGNIDKSRAAEWLSAALRDGAVRVFMRSQEDIFRVPHEDVQGLSRGWYMWLAEGVVPEPSREVKGPEWVAWEEAPFDKPVPRPKKRSEQHRLLALYHDGRLLLAESEFYRWLDDKTQIPKTGAPGRPSSMGIVITEFERRRELQQCEQSREAESQALTAWFKRAHPEMRAPTAKTIRNKLPPDFQPHTGQRPKL